MIGKANELKVSIVSQQYVQDSSIECGYRFISLEQALNDKLKELDWVEVVQIQYQKAYDGTENCDVSAMIIYRSAD